MSPEESVRRLAQILSFMPDLSEDDVYAAMEANDIAAGDADLAYKFLQIACGRVLLDGIARFSDRYFCLNASGDIVESGRMRENAFFAAAETVIRETPGQWIGPFGAMSADVNAINDALKKGSKPGNLQTGPAVLFLERPTAAGLEKANQLIVQQLRASAPPIQKKPWWRFW